VIQSWKAESLVGMRLGSCTLERPLGVGGMGAVFRARQDRPRRQVAVKVLRPQLATDAQNWPIFMARFQREADATAALEHANIVPIYEFGQEQNIAYLVMPYLPNGSLADLLARKGPLPVEQALTFLDGAAAALDYAHSKGIIHRDVKPSNLLIHSDGRLMLGDFGIARPLDLYELPPTPTGGVNPQLTQAGVAMGTPEFMAPEQIRGSALSAQTDIYGLGIVAYTMLTGHTPFSGTDVPTTLARQLNEPPQSIRRFRPDVPLGLEQAIFLALAKDPAQRPKSATEFAQMARNGARGLPLTQPVQPQQPYATVRLPLQRTAPASPVAAPPMIAPPVVLQAPPPVAPAPMALGFGAPPPNTVAMPPGSPAPGAATTYDAQRVGGAPYTAYSGSALAPGAPGSAPPQWPVRQVAPSVPQRGGGLRRFAMVIVSVIAVLALFCVGALFLNALGQKNTTGPTGSQSNPSGIATTRPSPTPSLSPNPSPTATTAPVSLATSTNSIVLGCAADGGGGRQTFQLTNTGAQDVQWTASVVVQVGSARAISIFPKSGSLASGESTTITVYYLMQTKAQQGFIKIRPNDDSAHAVMVQYIASPCGLSA